MWNKYLMRRLDRSEYKEEYDSLISLAKSRKLDKKLYLEAHSDETGTVYLSPKEHIIAHILLYRINPENPSLKDALDCFLGLVDSTWKENTILMQDESRINYLAELRELKTKNKDNQVVCYRQNSDNSISIVKIFNNTSDAQDSGFQVTVAALKSDSLINGYKWNYYPWVEENFPSALQTYLKNLPDRSLLILNKPNQGEEGRKIVAFTWNDCNVVREYDCLSDVEKDGFNILGVSVSIDKHKIYKGYNWEYSDVFEKEYPIKYNAYDPENLLPLNLGEEIVCYLPDNTIAKIYNSLENVEEDGFKKTSVCRALKPTSESKFYHGYYWKYLRDWEFHQDKLSDYYVRGPLEIHKDNLHQELNIVSYSPGTKEAEIFNGLYDLPEGINSKSVSKVLQKDTRDRDIKGIYWYRLSEFLALYPGESKNLLGLNGKDIDSGTEMHILLTISSKLISVNELYKARVSYTSGGRPYPVLYKNPKAQKVSDEVRNQLVACDFKKYIPWLKRTKKYSISINFILKTGITRRDCANFEKIMCDDLTRFIKNNLGIDHFDDSEFYECNFVKSICPSAKNEYAYIILKESYYEDRIDVVDKPSRVYLSGSYRPGIDWREELSNICETDESPSFSIYNPLKNIYDSELRDIERYKKCNTDLFVITPGDLSESMCEDIVTRVDKLTTFSENIFIYISVLGELEQFSDEELKRLEFIEKFASRPRVSFQYHHSINDIYTWIKTS